MVPFDTDAVQHQSLGFKCIIYPGNTQYLVTYNTDFVDKGEEL